MGKSNKYYVVWEGNDTGIFDNWEQCQQAVKNYPGPRFKAFNNEYIAELAHEMGPGANIWNNISEEQYRQLSAKIQLPELNSLSVDAACSGNPGIMEYQGVDTKSGIRLFHMGPFAEGTVNIGEFLAIVHGLAQLKKEKKNIPIYSDSVTAMKWVREKKLNTKLSRTATNKKLFEFVDRAVLWLKNNPYNIPVLKWDTETWGEIPADFGRK